MCGNVHRCGLEYARRLWAGTCPSKSTSFVGWNMPVVCGLEHARRLRAGTCPSFVGWNMPVVCGLEHARRLWAETCPSNHTSSVRVLPECLCLVCLVGFRSCSLLLGLLCVRAGAIESPFRSHPIVGLPPSRSVSFRRHLGRSCRSDGRLGGSFVFLRAFDQHHLGRAMKSPAVKKATGLQQSHRLRKLRLRPRPRHLRRCRQLLRAAALAARRTRSSSIARRRSIVARPRRLASICGRKPSW